MRHLLDYRWVYIYSWWKLQCWLKAHFILSPRLSPLLWYLQTWVRQVLHSSLFNIFLSFYLSRFSFYINTLRLSWECWTSFWQFEAQPIIVAIWFQEICNRKASAKTQLSLTSFLQSEVKIIHIIVQNNTSFKMSSLLLQNNRFNFLKIIFADCNLELQIWLLYN